jgi:hypothetical protein
LLDRAADYDDAFGLSRLGWFGRSRWLHGILGRSKARNGEQRCCWSKKIFHG